MQQLQGPRPRTCTSWQTRLEKRPLSFLREQRSLAVHLQRQGGGDVCGQQSAKKGEEGKGAADTRRDAETARKVERGHWGSAGRAEGAAEGRGVSKADRPALTSPRLDSQPQLRLVDGTRGLPLESPCSDTSLGALRRRLLPREVAGGGRVAGGCTRPLSWGILPSVACGSAPGRDQPPHTPSPLPPSPGERHKAREQRFLSFEYPLPLNPSPRATPR